MPKVNLLPGRGGRERTGRSGKGIVLIIALGLLEMVAIFYLYSALTKNIAIAQQRRQVLQKEVATLERELEQAATEAKIIPPPIEEEKPPEEKLEEALVPTPILLTLLEQIGDSLPKGAWLSRFEEGGGVCELEGYAYSKHEISELLGMSKTLPGVVNVSLIETERKLIPRRKIPLQHFTIQLTLGGEG
ncbi:PilN domain-containing protein [Bdellovibrionota bacterium]